MHIIAFNIPYPANYGGVIDVFYKIKALHEQGVSVILHAFQYGRKSAPELEKYCSQVYYYHRPTDLSKQFSSLPFIVKTRDAKLLLQNLKKDNHPILFEGLHTCYFLNHVDLGSRKKYVRMHNVEWQYYAHLAKMESNILKKIYFKIESKKLQVFEEKIKNVNGLLAISKSDADYFGKKYPEVSTYFIPAFHNVSRVSKPDFTRSGLETRLTKPDAAKSGLETRLTEKYLLFHGDLSVKDNEEAAFFLLEEIMQGVDYQLVIAGLNPTKKLKTKIKSFENVSLKANVSNEEMERLIKDAHVNILLSFQSAGMKLKLLNALFNGGFCVVNDFMVSNTGLEDLCFVGKNAADFQDIIKQLFQKEFSQKERLKRKERLEVQFSNQRNARRVVEIIFADI